MTHTRGPWRAEGKQVRGPAAGLIATAGGDFYDDGRKDANGWTFTPPLDTAANARLIAAAPEMLDALRLAADAIDLAQAQVDSENDRYNLCKRLVAVKRVIAKAEGRE